MTAHSTETVRIRENNFGSLRLLFAALVVISHSPELLDGNRSREILTQIFGTMSFGEVGVHGFFVISGYLITKSFIESRSVISYLLKRFFRIVPGYLVSFTACVFLVAPFVGGLEAMGSKAVWHGLLREALTLRVPTVPGVFAGLPYPVLNGSMWTISYEFVCYLGAACAGLPGLYTLRLRAVVLALVAGLLVLTVRNNYYGVHEYSIEFSGVFGVGAVLFLYRDRVQLTTRGALIAALLLAAMMFSRTLAGTAFAVCGGYLIIWAALKLPVLHISRWDNQTDISYGLYLYAWPVQSLIIWNDRAINPWLLCCLSLSVASALGYVSWTLVEKPMLRFAHSRNPDARMTKPSPAPS